MNSLWLRIEQQSQGAGILTLWEEEFEKRREPISTGTFSLASLKSVEGGTVVWTLARDVRQSSAVQVGQFDGIGETLRATLAACPVWGDWLSRRKSQTRTYFEIVDPPDAKMRLADLPFEYLAHVRGTGLVDRYFAVPDQPVMRVHSGTSVPAKLVRQAKVVIVSGEPIDWGGDNFPGDDVVAALREFQSCNLCAHIELLETPSLQDLEAALDRIKPEIIHFSGHGQVNPMTELPALRIGAPGGVWWWDTDRINTILRGKDWCPRLVVLNACDGAVTDEQFVSVMDAFAANGVAAVVGAQAQIRQIAAPVISAALYSSLVAKEPIDIAMVKVRTRLGNLQGGVNWHQRDWGLPVLSVAASPEELFVRPTLGIGWRDPEQVVMSCSVLRDFVQTSTRTTPFVALGWSQERWECLNYLSSAHCIIVKGVPGGGKSRLVLRSLRDAVFLGQQVRYVEVCSSKADATFIDLLVAIIDGDRSRTGSEVHKALKAEWFAEFNEYRNLSRQEADSLTLDKIQQICGAFERGLHNASSGQELTIVLDQFSRDRPRSSFSPDEFKAKLLPFLWTRIADGKVDGLRVIFVVRDDEYKDYDLRSLNGSEVQLRQFRQADHKKLFYELCRFRRKLISAGNEVPIENFEKISIALIGGNNDWPPSKLKLITDVIEQLP